MPGLLAANDDRLLAVVRGFKLLPAAVRRDLNKQTRQAVAPEWRRAVTSRARTRQDTRVLATGARVTAGNPPVLVAATSRRALSGGLVPREDWPVIEFGTKDRNRLTTYRRRGAARPVRRHTRRGLPRYDKSGRVVFAAVAESAPRFASLWVATFVRVVHHAARGEQV